MCSLCKRRCYWCLSWQLSTHWACIFQFTFTETSSSVNREPWWNLLHSRSGLTEANSPWLEQAGEDKSRKFSCAAQWGKNSATWVQEENSKPTPTIALQSVTCKHQPDKERSWFLTSPILKFKSWWESALEGEILDSQVGEFAHCKI